MTTYPHDLLHGAQRLTHAIVEAPGMNESQRVCYPTTVNRWSVTVRAYGPCLANRANIEKPTGFTRSGTRNIITTKKKQTIHTQMHTCTRKPHFKSLFFKIVMFVKFRSL